jgi:Ca-activated chloride channel family protein
MIYRFADPAFLALLVVVPCLVYWYVAQKRRRQGTLRYSAVETVMRSDVRRSGRFRHVPFGIRMVALVALIVAFARPQSGVTEENVTTQGIDIMLALDLSSSMLAEDLEPNRIEAAKAVGAQFVEARRNDRIGLVVFAAEAFTQAPLTLDYDVVTTLLGELEVGMIDDGTAIGMGLATAVKRLRDSDAESKVIVLLTDGRNNRGEIDPVTAAQMAQALGIKIYAIGAGMRVEIDEDVLEETADLTGGRYFRATDRESLEEIYREIDELETTEIEVRHFTRYGELFHLPLVVGLGLIVFELGLAHTVWRKIP